MKQEQLPANPPLKKWKIIVPVVIGIGASLYLFLKSFDPAALAAVQVTGKLVAGLILAALSVIIRDGTFVYKLRLSTGNKLSWKKSLQTVIMWEFGAAVTPKLSEAAFVLYVLKKSGLSYGRSVAVLMVNSFMDNLVFVLVFGILYLVIGPSMLQLSGDCPDLAGQKILLAVRGLADKAWIGYVLMVTLCAFLAVALFILPYSTKKFFYRLAGIRILNRFGKSLMHLGDEIEITSAEYKGQSFIFWIQFFFATFINWTFRYLLACCLLWAFTNGTFDLLQVYARQFVLWIFMVIPATPGSSGIAEISFIAMNCDFIPEGLSAAISFIWRIYSFYLYLVVGLIVLPKWVAGIVSKNDNVPK